MKKTKKISIRMSEEEFKDISSKAESSNQKLSSYARDAIFNTTVSCKKPSLKLLKELNSIGNNLNQVAKYCNTNKVIDSVVINRLVSIENLLYDLGNSYDS